MTPTLLPPYTSCSIEIKVPTSEVLTICRPDSATIQATAKAAKSIFVEAFTTTYTEYHKKSSSTETIETWLRLRSGLTLEQWLLDTFDNESREYEEGKIGFIYLIDAKQQLVGWLSHGSVSPEGDLYLSQCCLAADWRSKKVASTAFREVISNNHLPTMFPGVKAVKLIARRINDAASRLYTGAGFIRDETIDPQVYGSSYNDRYVGYQLSVI